MDQHDTSDGKGEFCVQGKTRILFLVLAAICFALGVIGVVLPLLPTTPFLLLTSYFLVRSSPKLNDALLQSKTFGPILEDWQLRGGIRKGLKRKAIICVMLAIGLTVWMSGYSLLPSVLVVMLSAIGIGVIIRVPTIDD